MNTADRDQELQDVLDAYMAEDEAPSQARLAAWTHRYPQYAQALTELTAAWRTLAWLPPTEVSVVDEARLVRRGMSLVGPLLRESAAQHAAQPAIASLLEEGRAQGGTVEALAARAGLSIPLVLKLDRRLIRFATLPRQVIEGVAAAIGRDAASVAAYLQGGPRLAVGASYHARQTPALGEQEDFAAAVRSDMTLGAERRAELLALQPPAGREAE